MDVIARWLLICLLIYIASGAVLYFAQRFFLYFPRPYVAVPSVKEIDITSGDVRLHGYVANSGKDRLLLYYGGNAEQVAVGIAQLAEHVPSTTIIGFDYRGYGRSEGRPSEEALYQDALAQYDKLASQYRQTSALGRSLGTAVATYLASQRDIDSLVLVTPVDSVARIASRRFWLYPIDFLLKDRFDSASRAGEINVPVLMLAAADDHLVSEDSLQDFKRKFASEQVTLVNIEGVSHNTIQNSPEFGRAIKAFLAERQWPNGE